jgi:hypothetical protein
MIPFFTRQFWCAGDVFRQATEVLGQGSGPAQSPWDRAVASAAQQLLAEWQQDLEE